MFQCNKITLEVTLHNYFMNHDMRAANENNKSKCITAIIVKLHLSFCLSLVKIFFFISHWNRRTQSICLRSDLAFTNQNLKFAG